MVEAKWTHAYSTDTLWVYPLGKLQVTWRSATKDQPAGYVAFVFNKELRKVSKTAKDAKRRALKQARRIIRRSLKQVKEQLSQLE